MSAFCQISHCDRKIIKMYNTFWNSCAETLKYNWNHLRFKKPSNLVLHFVCRGIPIRFVCRGIPIRFVCRGIPIRFVCRGITIRFVCRGITIRFVCRGITIRFVCRGIPVRFVCRGIPICFVCRGIPIRFVCRGITIRFVCWGITIRHVWRGIVVKQSALCIKPVLNWANACSPNILRTVRRTDSFLNWTFSSLTMVRTVQTLLRSQMACNETQASARTCGRRSADSMIENVG